MSGISHFTVSWKEVRVAFLWALAVGIAMAYAGDAVSYVLHTAFSPPRTSFQEGGIGFRDWVLHRFLARDLPHAALFAVGFAIPLLSGDRNIRIVAITFWIFIGYIADLLSGNSILSYNPVEVIVYGLTAAIAMIGACRLWDRKTARSEPKGESDAVVAMLDFRILGYAGLCGGIAGVLESLLVMLYTHLKWGGYLGESAYWDAQWRSLLPQFVYYAFALAWMIPARSALVYKWYLLVLAILAIPANLIQGYFADPAYEPGFYRSSVAQSFFVTTGIFALSTMVAIALYLLINPEKRVEASNARKADRQAENARRWLEENGP